MKRHFPHPQPTFGTKHKRKTPSAWKNSVYYWWWEYLRRNDDYRRTCQNGGKGKCAAIYKDFGDVLASDDFRDWWRQDDRGARLFAEPPTPTIQVIKEPTVLGSSNRQSLVLDVPLNLPITHLVKRFREILTKHHSGKRGVKVSNKTEAMYPVTSGRTDVNFLQIALQVWDARKANPKKSWHVLATELRLAPDQKVLTSDPRPVRVNKQNILASIASRYNRKAEVMIQNVSKGKFPMSSVLKH